MKIYCTMDIESDRVPAEEIIKFFDKHKIPATLFIESRWVKNKEFIKELSKHFSVQLHSHWLVGYYNWFGKYPSEEELYKELKREKEKLEKITGKKIRYFRSGNLFTSSRFFPSSRKIFDSVMKRLKMNHIGKTDIRYKGLYPILPTTLSLFANPFFNKKIFIIHPTTKLSNTLESNRVNLLIKFLKIVYPFAKWCIFE